MIFVIGNGNSRKDVNLNVLSDHGKTVGCNALYRDFAPTYLITHDSSLLHEICSSDYTVNNQLFLPEFSPIQEYFYMNVVPEAYGAEDFIENEKKDSDHFLMHTQSSTYVPIGGCHKYVTWLPKKHKIKKTPFVQDMHPINMGFNAIRLACELHPNEEIFMIGFDIFGERNNIYDGTKGYHTNEVPHFNEDKWVFLFNYLLDLYPDINIRRVIDEGPELEEIQNITYEELCQYLQINQKTLITSHQ